MCSMILIPESATHPDFRSLKVPVSPDFHSNQVLLVRSLLYYSSKTALLTELVCLLVIRAYLRVTLAKESQSLYKLHQFLYWPISLGISVTELRDRSKTMRLSKLEMNRGIFLSPIRCNCHSWIWESWTRAGGRVCEKSAKNENQTLDRRKKIVKASRLLYLQ